MPDACRATHTEVWLCHDCTFSYILFLVFSVKPGNIIAKLGLPARLDCQTDEPDSFVRWSYGGDITTILQPAECNCITLSNNSLYFNQTTHATGGDYTCLVFGASFGRINGSITIAGEVVIYIIILTLYGTLISVLHDSICVILIDSYA